MTPLKILGFPRSGTSLLQRLLTTHPQLHCPPETYVFSGAAAMIRESSGEGPDLGMLTGLAFSGFEEAEVLSRVRALAFGFMEDSAAAAGKPVWAEKSAFDIFDLAEIGQLLSGHVRFVAVVRHPLDVIASMKELTDQMGQNVPAMRRWMAQHDNYYLAWAAAWAETTTHLLDLVAAQGDAAMLYRFEDLAADPDAVLRRITDFAGLAPFATAPAPATDQIGLGDWKIMDTRAVSAAPVARWRKSLPRSSAAAALEIVAPLMDRLGYDIPAIRAPRSRAERVTQYRRAKALGAAARDARTDKG